MCRECYLVVDALAKLRTPTPEASPLLLAVMAHLAQGLDLRPQRPALHLNLLGTPPSQLIKLANAIKVRPRPPEHAPPWRPAAGGGCGRAPGGPSRETCRRFG